LVPANSDLGQDISFGTNGANSLILKTNGLSRLIVSSAGATTIGPATGLTTSHIIRGSTAATLSDCVVQSSVTTAGAVPKYILGVMRQGNTIEALYLGVDANNSPVIAANNTTMRFGKDTSGTFTETGSYTTSGAWQFGPQLALNYSGGPLHTFSGNWAVRDVTNTVADQRYEFNFLSNYDIGAGTRYSTNLGGVRMSINSRSADTTSCFAILTQNAGAALSGGASKVILTGNQLGIWEIGPSTGLGTSGSAYHTLYGSVVSRNTAAGFFAHPSQVSLAANNYRDGSGTLRAIDTVSGLGLIELRAVSSGSSNFFSLYASISAQTANTATTGLVEVMSLSALGAITSNHNSADGTHRFFGNSATALTRIYLGGNNDSTMMNIIGIGGATDAAKQLNFGDINTDCLTMRGDGTVRFPSTSTTASAANAFLDSGDQNRIFRSTSSIKYKQDVRYSVESSVVYNLKPCLYKSKVSSDDNTKDHLGFIAEDVHEIDPKLVHYMNEEPDGVQYERVTVLLVKAVQELRTELNQAKQEILTLKGN